MLIMKDVKQPPNHLLTDHVHGHLIPKLSKVKEHLKELIASDFTGKSDGYHIHEDVE